MGGGRPTAGGRAAGGQQPRQVALLLFCWAAHLLAGRQRDVAHSHTHRRTCDLQPPSQRQCWPTGPPVLRRAALRVLCRTCCDTSSSSSRRKMWWRPRWLWIISGEPATVGAGQSSLGGQAACCCRWLPELSPAGPGRRPSSGGSRRGQTARCACRAVCCVAGGVRLAVPAESQLSRDPGLPFHPFHLFARCALHPLNRPPSPHGTQRGAGQGGRGHRL